MNEMKMTALEFYLLGKIFDLQISKLRKGEGLNEKGVEISFPLSIELNF